MAAYRYIYDDDSDSEPDLRHRNIVVIPLSSLSNENFPSGSPQPGASVVVDSPDDILRFRYFFPGFYDLPWDNEFDARYHVGSSMFGYTTRTTWCFFAQIVDDRFAQDRAEKNGILVADRDGNVVPVIFNLGPDAEIDSARLKRNSTLIVFNAGRHVFMDCSWGMVIEDTCFVSGLNCTLTQLLALSAQYWKCLGLDVCWGCGAEKTHPRDLQLCGACGIATYCRGPDCQARDWRDRHRTWCQVLPHYAALAEFDFVANTLP